MASLGVSERVTGIPDPQPPEAGEDRRLQAEGDGPSPSCLSWIVGHRELAKTLDLGASGTPPRAKPNPHRSTSSPLEAPPHAIDNRESEWRQKAACLGWIVGSQYLLR